MGWKIRLDIKGQPPRKSNDRRISHRWVTDKTGKQKKVPMVIKSEKALQWVEDALRQIPGEAKQGVGSLDRPLAITFWCRYASRRPDLSVELVLDTLQEAGVIADDRYVYETHAFKVIDKDDPGVEILIEEAML